MKPELYLDKIKATSQDSDIIKHLDILRDCAKQCEYVTEFGFRKGISFSALLAGNPKSAISYDLTFNKKDMDQFAQLDTKTKISFFECSTLDCIIDETDLLFIDTLHTYNQLKEELRLHASKVRKFLIFHDVHTYGLMGEDMKEPGLMAAILEFMIYNDEWKIDYFTHENNGLLILRNYNAST